MQKTEKKKTENRIKEYSMQKTEKRKHKSELKNNYKKNTA